LWIVNETSLTATMAPKDFRTPRQSSKGEVN
jgi:hypothetical protein